MLDWGSSDNYTPTDTSNCQEPSEESESEEHDLEQNADDFSEFVVDWSEVTPQEMVKTIYANPSKLTLLVTG